MEQRETPDGTTDFIEAHVYGDLHPRAFESVHATIEDDELERALWNRMTKRLVKFGITFEEEFR
jgi:hypothetical protein